MSGTGAESKLNAVHDSNESSHVLPQTALSRAATAGQRWVRQIAVQDRKLARTTFKNILVLWFNIQYITIWYTDITVKLTNNACRRTLGLGGFKNLPTANIPLFLKVAVAHLFFVSLLTELAKLLLWLLITAMFIPCPDSSQELSHVQIYVFIKMFGATSVKNLPNIFLLWVKTKFELFCHKNLQKRVNACIMYM